MGRALVGLAAIIVLASAAQTNRSGGHNYLADIIIIAVAAAGGLISWLVTTWSVEGDTLQVHTGLIRRKTVRVPLSRAQAVDLVEPFLARILGLAEVRVRTGGGSGGDARLMYLKVDEAHQTRAALLAMAHGLPGSTPPPPEVPLIRVPNHLLVRSIALSGSMLGLIAGVLCFVGLLYAGSFGKAVIASSGGAIIYLFALGRGVMRRLVGEWDFEVAEAPDGLRIRCGLASRVAETIPYGRIQAVRMLEPLMWRPLGWCRLELHLAGSAGRKTGEPSGNVRRALLPVGPKQPAEMLLSRVLADHHVALTKPPRRAALRAPLSFHFLAAGFNSYCAVSVSGRVRRLTEWAPLAKLQSLRSKQGPVQRMLGIGSIHLDVAGRHATVRWLHRSFDEVETLMAVLPGACEAARDWEAASTTARVSSGAT